jgi:hypothetical protein
MQKEDLIKKNPLRVLSPLSPESLPGFQLDNAPEVEDELMRSRMIMTFKESAFSRLKLEERLNDLVYQNIFRPDIVVVDGFDFAEADYVSVMDLKEMMAAMNVQGWFSALRHRNDNRKSITGVPAPCHEMDGLFDTIILLQPEKDSILLNIIKDEYDSAAGKILNLDPSTMMVKEA